MSATRCSDGTTEAGSAPGVVVLHRLRFDPKKADFLERAGVQLVATRSVAETQAALEQQASWVAVLVDIGVGSNAPERIVDRARELGLAGRDITVIACATKRTGASARCRKLGIQTAYLWPDGAMAELARHLHGVPGVKLKRFAERASYQAEIEDADLGLQGKLLNISATGALIDCAPTATDVDALALELSVGGTTTTIAARVVWREMHDERLQLGVQFENLSKTMQRAITRFVRDLNAVRVGRGSAAPRGTPRRKLATVRVQRDRRVDYFLLEGQLSTEAILLQKKPFFVPYAVGDIVMARPLHAAAQPVAMRVADRCILDPDRIDSRIGWRVVREIEAVESLGHTGTGEHVLERPFEQQTLGALTHTLADARLKDLKERFGQAVLVYPPTTTPISDAPSTVFSMTLSFNDDVVLFDSRCHVCPLPPHAGEQTLTLGRSGRCDVVLEDSSVSSCHAELRWSQRGYCITDLESTNGTMVRGQRIKAGVETPVTAGEAFFLGRQRMHIIETATLRQLLRRLAPFATSG